MAAITIAVPAADHPERTTWVYYRGGAHGFDEQRDALAFVARRLADRPRLDVEVQVR